MKYISLLFFGLILIFVGIINIKGDISTVHWYNRARVTKADAPKYGKAMLQMIFDLEPLFWIAAAGTAAGAAVILFAQFKYNRGIF